MVDDRLANAVNQIGSQRQQSVGLIRIGNQIDDNLHVQFQGFDVILAGSEQGKCIGVVGNVLEEIFGWRIAGKRAVQCQDAKICGYFRSRPPDQGLYPGRFGIGRFGDLDFAGPLLDAADPVEALRVARVEGDGLLKTGDGRFRLIEFEMNLAKLMAKGAILRPFIDQLQQ
jgi:hypothetical protein